MKNTIIINRISIIALLMIILHGAGANASTPWTVTPGNYRYDMSLYLEVTFGDVKMDYSKYDVAAFCGNECRGIAERLPFGEGKECLYIRVRSNNESGETMTFKYYDRESGISHDIEGVSFQFKPDQRLGYPSEPFIVKILTYYDVTLSAGEGGTIDTESGRVAENTKIIVTATPAEGYSFEKWSDGVTDNPRTIIVTGNITLAAVFSLTPVTTYKLVYTVDGVPYKEYDVTPGTAITPEEYPQKEGHSFSGWEGLPDTMPENDVTVSGKFTPNSYKVTFKIGDETIETRTIVFGEAITLPETPVKEGHTFAGWEDIPATMPARDIVVTGKFTVNSYCLRLYLNGELYHSEMIEYGSIVTVPDPVVPEGMQFDGWSDDIPDVMPAKDVDIHGTYSEQSSVESISIENNEIVTIYTLSGQILYKEMLWQDIQNRLENGLYIINGIKYLIKK